MPEGKRNVQAPPQYVPRPFEPARWLPGAHAQTVSGRLLRRPRAPLFRRERWNTPDNDFIDLDFAPEPPPPERVRADSAGPPTGRDAPARAPLVLVLHGLEGSARRGSAVPTYDELARRGMSAVGLNFRSCSGEPNRTARSYHSGDTDDIRLVVGRLRERYGDVPIGAVGFSLGGNALIKYLAEEAAAGLQPVTAAVCISVPYDLAAGARHLDASRMGRFYVRLFVRSLIAKAEAKALLLAEHCDMDRIRRARTFYEFDDAATAPVYGFRSAEDYYEQCSSHQFVAGLRTPTLLLHAADDPFMPPDVFPHAAVADNPQVTAVVTQRGGHVGFVGGPPWRPRFWAEEEAARYLAAALLPLDRTGAGG
jgi:uncharacterized protein